MNNKIYPATENLYDEFLDIWEASVRATHHFLKEEDLHYYKPRIRNEYFYAVALFYTKDTEGRPNGFLGIHKNSIEMLFIHPDVRRAGLGSSLVNFAITQKNCALVEVNEANEQALNFYTKMGFKVIGRSPLDGSGKPYPIVSMSL